MSKTILHIGYPKTATKWFLGNFYPEVKNAGIIYNENLYYDTTPEKEYFEVRPDERFVERELKIIVTHALSGFINGSWKNGLYRSFFLRQLKIHIPEASVIIFIRNQFDFFTSLYSSYLKRGGTANINNYFNIESGQKGDLFSFEFLDYTKTIRLYQEQFGIENVHIFLFEEFMENNIVFLKNFTGKFGFQIDLDRLIYQKKNEKLRKGLAVVLRQSNKLFAKGFQPKQNYLNFPFIYTLFNLNIDKLNRYALFGKKLDSEKMLSEKLKQFIHEYYKASNQELISEFGLEAIKKYGYPL